jgi:hypothetical protein
VEPTLIAVGDVVEGVFGSNASSVRGPIHHRDPIDAEAAIVVASLVNGPGGLARLASMNRVGPVLLPTTADIAAAEGASRTGSALGSDLDEVIRLNALFGEKVQSNAALMRAALSRGDESLLQWWLYPRCSVPAFAGAG